MCIPGIRCSHTLDLRWKCFFFWGGAVFPMSIVTHCHEDTTLLLVSIHFGSK